MEGTDWNSGGVVQEIILKFRCWNVGVWVVVGLCPTSLVWPMFDICLYLGSWKLGWIERCLETQALWCGC